jgi:hypothetical protein
MPLPKLIPQPQNIKFLRIRKANRAGRVVSKRGVNNARYSFHVHISFHNSSPDFRAEVWKIFSRPHAALNSFRKQVWCPRDEITLVRMLSRGAESILIDGVLF